MHKKTAVLREDKNSRRIVVFSHAEKDNPLADKNATYGVSLVRLALNSLLHSWMHSET
jgi:hypothetical protein